MSLDSLVKMANDIGQFFAAESSRAEAITGIANHLQRFWDPRMRAAIVRHLQAGGAGLDELVRAAVATLPAPPAVVSTPTAQGPSAGGVAAGGSSADATGDRTSIR